MSKSAKRNWLGAALALMTLAIIGLFVNQCRIETECAAEHEKLALSSALFTGEQHFQLYTRLKEDAVDWTAASVPANTWTTIYTMPAMSASELNVYAALAILSYDNSDAAVNCDAGACDTVVRRFVPGRYQGGDFCRPDGVCASAGSFDVAEDNYTPSSGVMAGAQARISWVSPSLVLQVNCPVTCRAAGGISGQRMKEFDAGVTDSGVDATDASDASDAADATDASDASDAADATDAADAADASDASDASGSLPSLVSIDPPIQFPATGTGVVFGSNINTGVTGITVAGQAASSVSCFGTSSYGGCTYVLPSPAANGASGNGPQGSGPTMQPVVVTNASGAGPSIGVYLGPQCDAGGVYEPVWDGGVVVTNGNAGSGGSPYQLVDVNGLGFTCTATATFTTADAGLQVDTNFLGSGYWALDDIANQTTLQSAYFSCGGMDAGAQPYTTFVVFQYRQSASSATGQMIGGNSGAAVLVEMDPSNANPGTPIAYAGNATNLAGNTAVDAGAFLGTVFSGSSTTYLLNETNSAAGATGSNAISGFRIFGSNVSSFPSSVVSMVGDIAMAGSCAGILLSDAGTGGACDGGLCNLQQSVKAAFGTP